MTSLLRRFDDGEEGAVHRRTRAVPLLLAVAAMVTGCGAASGAASPTVLTIQVPDDATGDAYRTLVGEYDRAHSAVKVVVRELGRAEAREELFGDLGRKGLADIVTIDSAWLPELMRYSDLLASIPKAVRAEDADRWPDWAVRSVMDGAGRTIAYPAGIAPRALCYRPDLFAAAGLPSDSAAVAAVVDDWTTLLATAEEYTAATGSAFFDSAASAFTVMMDQFASPFEVRASGEIVATRNPAVRTAFDRVTAAPGVFADLEPGTDEWRAGAAAGTFAVSLCTAGTAEPLADAADAARADDVVEAGTGTLAALLSAGWEVADAFPGAGANAATTSFAIPAAGAHVDRAHELADWLTAPEQQAALFAATGTFPSARFGDDPTGDEAAEAGGGAARTPTAGGDGAGDTVEPADTASPAPTADPSDPFTTTLARLLRDRAGAITVTRFRGPATPEIEHLMRDALASVRAGVATPDEAWNRWAAAVDALTQPSPRPQE
jgi:cellobiose transport system substrate-binding protein